jgi:hypothetical protein
VTDPTSDLEAMTERAVAIFRQVKEQAVGAGRPDVPAQVGVFRDGAIVAIVVVGPGPEDAIARMAFTAVVGFRADTIALVSDSFQAVIAEDGEVPEWLRSGEMQQRWEAGLTEGITEALVVIAMNAENSRSVCVPYVTAERSVMWDDTYPMRMDGGLLATISDAFAVRPEYAATGAASAAILALDDDAYRLRADAAAVRRLTIDGCRVAWVGTAEDRQAMTAILAGGADPE